MLAHSTLPPLNLLLLTPCRCVSRYENDALCEWRIDCGEGLVSLAFTAFETEDKYDVVTIFDGPTADSAEMHQLSGSLTEGDELGYTSSGTSMLVEFQSDESISGPGFEATYTCGAAGRDYTNVATDGTEAFVQLSSAGQQEWFSFTAVQGETYVINSAVTGGQAVM